MIEQNFCNYNLSKQLKEIGFDEHCIAAYMKTWSGESYMLEENPLKLDDRIKHEPLATFYETLGSLTKTDSLISYNFNESIENVDGEGNEYYEIYSAPLYQQVISWFETNHNLEIMVKSWIESKEIIYMYSVNKLGSPSNYDNKYVSKELAMDMAINRAIEIVKNKKI